MNKITTDELINRIDEIERMLFSKLNLKEYLTDDNLVDFYESFIPYIKHSRNEEVSGRRPETLEKYIDRFISFSNIIDLSNMEVIEILKKHPSILHDEDFINKYIFLSVIENENNTLRKTKLIEKPQDFRVSLETIYARYLLMKDLRYPDINWSNLVHESHYEFAKKFVKVKATKIYKVFDSLEDISEVKLKAMYPVDYSFIEELKNNELNNFGGIGWKL